MSQFFSSIVETFSENIPAQIIGFIGLALIVSAYQFNNSKTINLFYIFSGIFFTIHFYMLGAYTGALINLLSSLSCIIFNFRGEKKWASTAFWPILFSALGIVLGIFTWENFLSLLPMVSFCFSRASLFCRNATLTRLLMFPASILFWIYNFANASFSGVLTESIVLVIAIVAVIRFDILKKEEKKKA